MVPGRESLATYEHPQVRGGARAPGASAGRKRRRWVSIWVTLLLSPGCPSGRERLWPRAQQASGEARGPLRPGAGPPLKRDLRRHQPRCGAQGQASFPRSPFRGAVSKVCPPKTSPLGSLSLSLSQTRRSPFRPTRCPPASPSSPRGTASGLPAPLRASGKAQRPPPFFHNGSTLAGLHRPFPTENLGGGWAREGRPGGLPFPLTFPDGLQISQAGFSFRSALHGVSLPVRQQQQHPGAPRERPAARPGTLDRSRTHPGPSLPPRQPRPGLWKRLGFGIAPAFHGPSNSCSFSLRSPLPRKCPLGSRVRTPRPAPSPAFRLRDPSTAPFPVWGSDLGPSSASQRPGFLSENPKSKSFQTKFGKFIASFLLFAFSSQRLPSR